MEATIQRVLVAGATGYLGRNVVKALKDRGIWVRALVRDARRAEGLGADQVVRGEVTVPASLEGSVLGVDAVISCVGITRQREGCTYDDVDYQGNLNLLRIAQAEGAKTFEYVSLFRGEELQHLRIAAAKERFVAQLRATSLNTIVVRPTAFFSDMAEILTMAREGRVFVFGAGDARLNPISGRDAAAVCVRALQANIPEVEIGGPQIFTHLEIAKLAFQAIGKRPHISHLPRWMAAGISRLLRFMTPVSVYGPIEFFLTVATQDMAAPPGGQDRLSEFFRSKVEGFTHSS